MSLQLIDIRDESIIDSFPVLNCDYSVLNVGCGRGRIDFYLSEIGYNVLATDAKRHDTWKDGKRIEFRVANIFDETFHSADIVICSEVLEHLKEWRIALGNLVKAALSRLIVTVPLKKSYDDPDHCNYWDDHGHDQYSSVSEFVSICHPFSVSISKIRTKPEDKAMGQWAYLIVVDKKQRYQ